MRNPDSAAQSSLALATPVVLAGVPGTVANAVVAAILVSPASIRLALVPGRDAVALYAVVSFGRLRIVARQMRRS